MSEGTRGLIVPSELVIELEREYDKSRERIAELEKQLAAMSEPPVWRDGPPPEPGVWWQSYDGGPWEICVWNQNQIDITDESLSPYWRHAPAPEWLKPPVDPNPVPKPDPCEDWIARHQHNVYELVVVDAGGGRKLCYPKDTIRNLWPHIEAAIKGGVK